MKYEPNIWYGWNGGECPVHPETLVEVMLQSGFNDSGVGSTEWDWGICKNPIIAFRVIKPYREPREVYLNEWSQYSFQNGKSEVKDTWSECSPDDPRAVLFREVIE